MGASRGAKICIVFEGRDGAGMGERRLGGRAVAVIDLNEDTSPYNLPGGSAAQVALYKLYWHHFAIIRRILLRMRSWQNYVFLEGH